MYAILGTRPDIAFIVSMLAESHTKATQRIFFYLRDSINYNLVSERGAAALLPCAPPAKNRNLVLSTSFSSFLPGSILNYIFCSLQCVLPVCPPSQICPSFISVPRSLSSTRHPSPLSGLQKHDPVMPQPRAQDYDLDDPNLTSHERNIQKRRNAARERRHDANAQKIAESNGTLTWAPDGVHVVIVLENIDRESLDAKANNALKANLHWRAKAEAKAAGISFEEFRRRESAQKIAESSGTLTWATDGIHTSKALDLDPTPTILILTLKHSAFIKQTRIHARKENQEERESHSKRYRIP